VSAAGPWVALAGNPNTGKTTLFNALTGLRGKVSNYPGVTVDLRHGTIQRGQARLPLTDIPGTYSLVARSPDEQIAIDELLGRDASRGRPSAVAVCVDATQPARSLYLVLQLLELGLPCVVALTMIDEAGDAAPDAGELGAALGCPVVAVVARTGAGLDALVAALERVATSAAPAPRWHWQPSPELVARIDRVAATLPEAPSARAEALWALQSLGDEDELLHAPAAVRSAVAAELAGGPRVGHELDDEVALGRWRFLDQAVAPLVRRAVVRHRTERVDRVLLHRVLGFGVFALLMATMFMSLFAWADPAIGGVEAAFAWLGERAREALPAGVLADFVVDGVIAGVGSVVVFLPQLLLLFFFLGMLEDCGYLARVAYLMDRLMRAMNLSGRAFVPMLSGFACAVPAVAATRTMERRRDRILTMMVVPLMTCSARLPVYTLVIATMVPGSALMQSGVMVGMYAFSTVTALIAAWVMSKTVRPLKAKRLPFVIELPPYRLPRWRDVLRMMWSKSSMFLREAGTVILVCTIALWALLYFPRDLPAGAPDFAAQASALEATKAATPADDAAALAALDAQLADLEHAEAGLRLEHSYGGQLGHAIEPAIAPLGFDWKFGVGIIGAFAAREVFVSTMGVVFSLGGDVDENDPGLRQKIAAERTADGAVRYTPLVGVSLMVFFALACQCLSTLAVVRRETGGYRWPLFLFTYMTVLAYLCSLLVYQGGRLLGLG
jgi:ferrous iron transport protein B